MARLIVTRLTCIRLTYTHPTHIHIALAYRLRSASSDSRLLTLLRPPAQIGRTGLIQASFNGHLAIVGLLLDKGASVNAADQVAQRTPASGTMHTCTTTTARVTHHRIALLV